MKSYFQSLRGKLISIGDLAFVATLMGTHVELVFVVGGVIVLVPIVLSILDKNFCERGDDLWMFGFSCVAFVVGFAFLTAIYGGTEAEILLTLSAGLFWIPRRLIIRFHHYTRKYGAF